MLIPFDQLFKMHNLKFTGVLHIGANIGEEANMYNKLGIKKQIWIEANPDIFLKLKHNISGNPDAIALNYCIGDENKDTVLHIANNSGQSSSVLEFGTHKEQHPTVHYIGDIPMKMHRIDSLSLDLTGVDLLNIDLQGFELQALKGFGDIGFRNFKACYLEINKDDVYRGCAQVESIDLFMVANGFRRVETRWCGSWGDGFYIR